MPYSRTLSFIQFSSGKAPVWLAIFIFAASLALATDSGLAWAADPIATPTPIPASSLELPAMAPVVPTITQQPPKGTPTPQPSSADTGGRDSVSSQLTQFKVTSTDQEGLRVRSSPSLAAPIVARIPEGSVVSLGPGVATEADDERWLPVKVDSDTRGWVAARYLVRVKALAPIAKPLPANASFGDKVVYNASAYIGQPYVWGGAEPGGFDCSGLVQWVFNKAGFDMPRLIPEQLAAGKKVSPSSLRPGDLIAFENTYRPGLSHVGIFIGNDSFIHASDEAHGVMISSLSEDYWKARYVTAVRLR